jgi:hypothetical protein
VPRRFRGNEGGALRCWNTKAPLTRNVEVPTMRAIHTPTTSRRALCGAGASLLLLLGAAGETKAAELDGELLAACERFIWLEGEFSRNNEVYADALPGRETTEQQAAEAAVKIIFAEQCRLGLRIAAMQAKTPEGLQAKARVIVAHLNDEPERDMSGLLQASLACDTAGEGPSTVRTRAAIARFATALGYVA